MKITPNNWLYNAGIIGLLRILREKGITFDDQLRHGYFELLPEHLIDLADSYFAFIMKSFPERFFGISLKADEKGEAIIKDFKQAIQVKVSNARKEKLKEVVFLDPFPNYADAEKYFRNSVDEFHLKILSLVEKEFEMKYTKIQDSVGEKKQKDKSLQTLEKEKAKATKRIKEYYDNLPKLFEQQKFAVDNLQRFYFNKKIIGNYNFPGTERIQAFQEIYVDLAISTLHQHEQAEGLTCKFCNQNRIDNTKVELLDSVFNEGLFSTSAVSSEKFSNFFYNLQPDLFICSVCELILLCAWAGFNQIPYRFRSSEMDTEFILVNLPSFDLMLHENDKIQRFYKITSLDGKDTIYETVFSDLFVKEKIEKSQWVLQNILFVEIKPVPRKDQAKPIFRYFHVGKDVAKLFTDNYAINSLRHIMGQAEVQRNINLYLKKDIIRRFLNNEPVHDLAFKILLQIIKKRKGTAYNLFCLTLLDSIRNNIWIEHKNLNEAGVKPMDSKKIYGVLKRISDAGADFVGVFEKDKSRDFEKRQRLSYRLLSLIRTGKYTAFYDFLMKMYIDVSKPIPEELLGILNTRDIISFESKAYAFMSGFLKDVQSSQQVTEQKIETENKIL